MLGLLSNPCLSFSTNCHFLIVTFVEYIFSNIPIVYHIVSTLF
jgi:hypothetical protein